MFFFLLSLLWHWLWHEPVTPPGPPEPTWKGTLRWNPNNRM